MKTAPAKVKTVAQADDLAEGEFEAIVSVFNTVDSVGDIVMPGAFKNTLAGFADNSAPVPVVWSHDWKDPFSHIGYSVSAEEVEAGLKIRGKLDIHNNPKAAQVYRLLKGGRVRDFSFAYEIKDGGFREPDPDREKDGALALDEMQPYELRELELFEVGPCLVGAHRDTELLDIKASAGRETITDTKDKPTKDKPTGEPSPKLGEGSDDAPSEPADLERIVAEAAQKFAQDLLAVMSQRAKDGNGQAMPAQPATTEEPAGAKVDPPARQGAASERLRSDLHLLMAEVDALEDN